MRDTNLQFWSGVAITTTTTAPSDLDLRKTGPDGVDVEVAVTAVAGSTTGRTLDIVVSESNDDSTYNNLVTFEQITSTGRWTRRVKSNKRYVRMVATVGTGTGASFTVDAGVASGRNRDQ